MMDNLLGRYYELIDWLIEKYQANILLISAYQSGIEPWEDDEYYLKIIKEHYAGVDKVQKIYGEIALSRYFSIIGNLDLMIGMCLHTSLTALRLGVPSLNISYTDKGHDILNHLGLGDYGIGINDFLLSIDGLSDRFDRIIINLPDEKTRVKKQVDSAIKLNIELLQELNIQMGI